MNTDELNEYLVLRDAYLNDTCFQQACNNDNVGDKNVVRYLTVKDSFDQTWALQAQDLHLRWFADTLSHQELYELLETHVFVSSSNSRTTSTPSPKRLRTISPKDDVCVWTGERTNELTRLLAFPDPVALWHSMSMMKWIQYGSLDQYLQHTAVEPKTLVVSKHLEDLLRACWIVVNADKVVDVNLILDISTSCIIKLLQWSVGEVVDPKYITLGPYQ